MKGARPAVVATLLAAAIFGSKQAHAETTRHLDLGPYVGVALRPAVDGPVSYGPGLLLGARALAFLCDYLRIGIAVDFDEHAVDGPALGVARPTREHPDLTVYRLSASIDPTWPITPRFSAWASVGASWARLVAPFYEPADFRVPRRTGVDVEIPLGLGASFEVVPKWVSLGAWGAYGIPVVQSGSLFERSQVVQKGKISSVSALPELGPSLLAAAQIMVIL